MNLSGMPHVEMPDNLVNNTSFYPSLALNEFSEQYGVNSDYGTNVEMVMFAISSAMLFVNDELSTYNALNWHNQLKLEDVESTEIDGVKRLIALYKQAVFSLAKAKLLISRLSEMHRDKQAAQNQQANDNEHFWRKQSFAAIRQMMEQSENLTVALI
jgi:hypothetical protein